MKLKIRHETRHFYDAPVPYALQRLRLTPRSNAMQSVLGWKLTIEGAGQEVSFHDQFGNETTLISVSGEPHEIVVTAGGEVETHDRHGIFGANSGFAPLWLFLQPTALTRPSEAIVALAGSCRTSARLDMLHGLVAAIRERVSYVLDTTTPETTADMALQQGQGVCQDHAQIFVAAARASGVPARYVSGYLMLDDRTDQVATHAWAEAWVEELGWVGFDVSNGISPDERYVRLAVGRDYRDAMPASGIRMGQAKERLEVQITVEQ